VASIYERVIMITSERVHDLLNQVAAGSYFTDGDVRRLIARIEALEAYYAATDINYDGSTQLGAQIAVEAHPWP